MAKASCPSKRPAPNDHEQDSGHEDDDDDSNQNHTSAEAAGGVMRGAARSLGRSVVRSPIGSLPRRAVFRRPLPVRQVARVSDRLSTGYDWWSSAVESTEDATSSQRRNSNWVLRVRAFATSLVKNTLLGAAVFETYGYIVCDMALSDPQDVHDEGDFVPEPPRLLNEANEDDEHSMTASTIFESVDAYDRASLPIHFGAGWMAGSVHGVAGSIIEAVTDCTGSAKLIRSLPANVLHHAVAHSLLFGSYEGLKRHFIWRLHSMDDGTQYFDSGYFDSGYLFSFGIAGGLAGQVQHASSHYLEQWLGITTAPVIKTKETLSVLSRLVANAPLFRPTLSAFAPSALGFIAFEYGKKFTT